MGHGVPKYRHSVAGSVSPGDGVLSGRRERFGADSPGAVFFKRALPGHPDDDGTSNAERSCMQGLLLTQQQLSLTSGFLPILFRNLSGCLATRLIDSLPLTHSVTELTDYSVI
jgi:hypothetical protein